MKKISVSFLSSKNIEKDLLKLNLSSADYIHVDVMDGRFVKKKNNPYKKLSKLSNMISKRLDVHLMDRNPLKNINYYASLNTEYITVHVELEKIDKYIDLIKEYGIKCGLAINPETDVSMLMPYLSKIDMILVMSVHPGLGGQDFIEDTYKKILKLKKMISSRNLKIKLSVDGGVNDEIVKKLEYVDIIVSGSYVTNGESFDQQIESLRTNASDKEKLQKD